MVSYGLHDNEFHGGNCVITIVLVDKPVLPTASEARELGRIAKSKNLVLYAYQNRRWDSDFLSLKRLLEEPATSPVFLGDIIEFESQ